MKKTLAWWTFAKERFEPISHLIMIVVFILAHVLIIKAQGFPSTSWPNQLLLFIGVVAFYFKLRLYDEVKDYELDVIINKTRPLPRGLLTHRDMYQGMATCIVIELICFGLQGINAFLTVLIAILYSLLMYKEFFIKEKIRPLLTTYALMHTIVTTWLSFAIFSFLSKESLLVIIKNKTLVFFALANWLLFNIFEFGRKTFATSEEREHVDTYSSLFGRSGAVLLVFSQALLAHFLTYNLSGTNLILIKWGFGFLLITLGILSLRYVLTDHPKAAKHYRLFSSIYIIVFYLILIFAHLIN